MKKFILNIFFLSIMVVLVGCQNKNIDTLDFNVTKDIHKVVDSKIDVIDLVPTTLKVDDTDNSTSNITFPIIYNHDELQNVQSEGFKLINQHVVEIDNYVDIIYEMIDKYLNKVENIGQIVELDGMKFILTVTNTGYEYNLVGPTTQGELYFELKIEILDNEEVYITARYEIVDVLTTYIELAKDYINIIYSDSYDFLIGELVKDQEGNTTIKNYYKNLISNHQSYLIAFGNENYSGITRYQFDDIFTQNTKFVELYDNNAQLIFQSYQLDKSNANYEKNGARWFLANVDGWNSITNKEAKKWEVTDLKNNVYQIETIKTTDSTRSYKIENQQFNRVKSVNNRLQVKKQKVLVLSMEGQWLDNEYFTLPSPFTVEDINILQEKTKYMVETYDTSTLLGMNFKDVTYEEAVKLIPEKGAKFIYITNVEITSNGEDSYIELKSHIYM